MMMKMDMCAYTLKAGEKRLGRLSFIKQVYFREVYFNRENSGEG